MLRHLMLRLLRLLLPLFCRLVGLVRLPDMRLYARIKLATCHVPVAQGLPSDMCGALRHALCHALPQARAACRGGAGRGV